MSRAAPGCAWAAMRSQMDFPFRLLLNARHDHVQRDPDGRLLDLEVGVRKLGGHLRRRADEELVETIEKPARAGAPLQTVVEHFDIARTQLVAARV